MFRATVCPSSGEITVFMRHLLFVPLKQVESLKLQGLMSQNEGCYGQVIRYQWSSYVNGNIIWVTKCTKLALFTGLHRDARSTNIKFGKAKQAQQTHQNTKTSHSNNEVIPQQTWRGPRGSGSVKAPDFRDVRHKGGRSSTISTGRLYPRRNARYSFSGAKPTPRHMVPSRGATEKIHRESIPGPSD